MNHHQRPTQSIAKFLIQSLLLALAVAGVLWAGGASSPGVKWVSLDKAVKAARLSGKPLMYDFSAEWCGPCQMLARAVFEDAQATKFINDHYVPVRVIDRYREDGQNSPAVQALQHRFQLTGFPTLAVETADRKRQDMIVGFLGYDGTMEFLRHFVKPTR
jgi:thiol:disulfide interchange protein